MCDLLPQSVRWYVCELERTIISACGRFGIEASTSPHTGVWVRDNKICAIGKERGLAGVRCSASDSSQLEKEAGKDSPRLFSVGCPR